MKKDTVTIKLDKKSIATFLALVGLVLVGFGAGSFKDEIASLFPATSGVRLATGEKVSAKQLIGMMKKKDFTLVNVHTPYEGEIAQTDTFIPYDQIAANSSSLPKDKNAPIVLYCKTGRMSGEAVETIKKLGYTNVKHLDGGIDAWLKAKQTVLDLSKLEEEVTPAGGVELPVSFGTLLPKLVSLGAIDLEAFKKAVNPTDEQLALLTEGSDQKIKIDRSNGQFIVDVLWALGLAQKSLVYDEGPLGKEYKKDVGNFASTGGWNLAKGNAVNYLNKYDLIPLTPEQQKQVGEIAKNVYRPCCGNSTWFPDCNHGMAALAAIELMVSAGIAESDIYRYVLALNSYWFSSSYLTVATHFARQGTAWKDVDARLVLGATYSSSQGAGETAKKVGPLPYKPQPTGGGCSS